MRIDVVTLFAAFFESPLRTGLVGRALERDVQVGFVDPRDFTEDVHRTVDDTPYGGGGGMVMKVEPLAAAIEAARARGTGGGSRVVMLTPQGRPMRQDDLRRWATVSHMVLVAGRYEGFDERVRTLVDEEVSLGDFVLTGGEIGALALIDGVVRLRPGTLGNQASPEDDSFSPGLDGLLEFPQYTRPADWRGLTVPEPLTSGDHGRVARWRRTQSLARTRARRPDLLRDVPLGLEDQLALRQVPSPLPPLHWVLPGDGLSEADLGLLLAAASAYGVGHVFLWVAPDQVDTVEARVGHTPAHESAAVADRRGRRRLPPAVRAPADVFRVVVDRAGVDLQVGPDARWVVSARPESPERVRPWSEFRSGTAPVLLAVGSSLAQTLGDGLPQVPGLRRASEHSDLPPILVLTLQTERWAGEA